MRLSESLIWQAQKEVYGQLGIASWTDSHVPFLITNNGRLAKQYAEIAFREFGKSFFRILELGGGCGRFAYLFCKELLQKQAKFQYVLTDAATKNVEFWQKHPLFQDWLATGQLVIDVYDPLKDPPIGADLIVANYFFDTIAHDLYKIENGELLEGQATSGFHYEFKKLQVDPYPDFPEASEILKSYQSSGTFLFPIEALRVIQKLGKEKKYFVADRGVALEVSNMSTQPSFHGKAFSFAVNFDALFKFVGNFFFKENESFIVAALSCHKARSYFESQVFGCLQTEAKDFSGILNRLKEANWDATIFLYFFDRIQKGFSLAKEEERREMLEGMSKIHEKFFPLTSEEELLLSRLRKIGIPT